jgi:methylenetetrahydrofolate reductase (NADPH)
MEAIQPMTVPPAATHFFRPDVKLTDVLSRNRFTVSAEVIPPRNGAEQVKVLEQVRSLVGAGAEFLAVTKGAGGSLRGGSLPIAQAIKEGFQVPAIAHFTCRDLTQYDIENQLVDYHYFGIRNVLALRGDPPDGQPHWQAREGGYEYAYQLIEQVRGLNEGRFLDRAGGPTVATRERTDFCIGAAAYPEHPNDDERFRFFKQKVDAGAEYGITDVLFDAEAYGRFLDGLEKRGVRIPILPGTRVLRSRAQAQRMMQKFKVRVPAAILEKLPEKDSPEGLEIGLEIFASLVERLRGYGAPGMHVFVIVDTDGGCEAIRRLKAKVASAAQV